MTNYHLSSSTAPSYTQLLPDECIATDFQHDHADFDSLAVEETNFI